MTAESVNSVTGDTVTKHVNEDWLDISRTRVRFPGGPPNEIVFSVERRWSGGGRWCNSCRPRKAGDPGLSLLESRMTHYICLLCPQCKNPFKRVKKEVTRSRSRGRPIFCSLSCGTKARAKVETRVCPCGNSFVVKSRKKAARHCSGSCASKYSMNDERREAQRTGGRKGGLLFAQKFRARVDLKPAMAYQSIGDIQVT